MIQDIEKEFKCSLCKSSFTRNNDLKRHISSVHEGKRPFNCEKCDSTFKESSHLKSHERRVHEGTKTFSCTYCDKRFSGNNDLTRHLSTVHGVKTPYNCNFCDISFKWNSNLRRHLKSVHKRNLKGLPKRIRVLKKENLAPQMEGKKKFRYLCKKISTTLDQKELIKELTADAETILDTSKLQGGHICDKCQLSFVDKISVNEHKASKHYC